VQTALHQRLGFADARQLDRLLGGGVVVRDIDELASAEVQFQLFGDRADLCRRADEVWLNDPGLGRVNGARQ
jgi:hypothetical protein